MSAVHGTGTASPSMSFNPDESSADLDELVGAVMAKESTDERVAGLDRSGATYDEHLWQALSGAGVIEALLPARFGGDARGMVGLMLALAHAGRRLARVPLLATGVGALALARAGETATGERATALGDLLDGVRAGSVRFAAAAPEPMSRATVVEGRLTGRCDLAYQGGAATHLLVVTAATADTGPAVHAIEVDRVGVLTEVWTGTSSIRHLSARFDEVELTDADRLGGAELADQVRLQLLVGAAALTLGAGEEALARTAAYTSTRQQFGRPLSTNQGVALRAADAYIDTEALRVTTTEAAWLLDDDGPRIAADTREAALTAAWWAKEAGFRIVHTTQHLHGGAGSDVDNHIHRFFTFVKELELIGGPAPALLDELGAMLPAGRANP